MKIMGKFDSRVFMASLARKAGQSPEFAPGWKGLRKILRLHGDEFVIQAYRLALKREADPAGLAGYGNLSRNIIGRLYVLGALLFSPENPALPFWAASLRCRLGGVLNIFRKKEKK